MWKYSSFWYKDFNGMAFKTMLRQLISKWGIMSIDMQEGYTKDMATIKENGDYEYIESVDQPIDNTIDVPVETEKVEEEPAPTQEPPKETKKQEEDTEQQ